MSSTVSSLRARLLSAAPFGVALVFALAATVGVVSGGAFGGIGIGGALLLALWFGAGEGRAPRPSFAALGFAGIFLLLGGLSAAIALDPALALKTTLKMATIFLPLSFWLGEDFKGKGDVISKNLLLLVLLLCFGFLMLDGVVLHKLQTVVGDKDFAVSKLNRGFSYGALLALPLFGALFASGKEKPREKLLFGGLLALCLLVSLLLTNSRATQTGVLAALGVGILGRFFPKATLRLLGFGILLTLFWPLAAPFIYGAQPEWMASLPPSWIARMEIWDYVGHKIFERPFLGYGLGNSHLLFFTQPHDPAYLFIKTAAHPHNAVTQVWAELGLFGLLWWGALNFWVLRGVQSLSQPLKPYAFGAYALALWLCLVAYSLWTDSLWASFALTAYLFKALDKRRN